MNIPMCKCSTLDGDHNVLFVLQDFHNERNKVGVDDMVMLSEISEKSIIENLKKRYAEGMIYVSDRAASPSTNHRIASRLLLAKC